MIQIHLWGVCMSKSNKKKDKVPKITEAEYAAYLSALRGETETEQQEKQETETRTAEKQ